MSEQAQRQLERGASKFEDISLGENRPTQLVKRYGNLYSEARLDAMDALDELPDMADADDLKVKLLLSIVVVRLVSTASYQRLITTTIVCFFVRWSTFLLKCQIRPVSILSFNSEVLKGTAFAMTVIIQAAGQRSPAAESLSLHFNGHG